MFLRLLNKYVSYIWQKPEVYYTPLGAQARLKILLSQFKQPEARLNKYLNQKHLLYQPQQISFGALSSLRLTSYWQSSSWSLIFEPAEYRLFLYRFLFPFHVAQKTMLCVAFSKTELLYLSLEFFSAIALQLIVSHPYVSRIS